MDSQNKCSKDFDLDEKEETSTFFQLENDLILMTIEFLNPEGAPAPAGSYSNLAIIPPGKTILVIVGQIGNLIDGIMVDGLEAQYEQTLKNIHALVTSQGGSKHDIARITFFLTEEPSDWSKIKDANEKYLNQLPPAKTWIYVSKLFKPEVKVEIEALAAVD